MCITSNIKRGPPTRPCVHGSYRHGRWSNEGTAAVVFQLSRSRLGVDRLVTLLGIDESLAFRVFDKTIIFGHWLLKTQKLALAPGPFPFEKDLYYILVDYFQKSKNLFLKGRL